MKIGRSGVKKLALNEILTARPTFDEVHLKRTFNQTWLKYLSCVLYTHAALKEHFDYIVCYLSLEEQNLQSRQ